MLDDAGVLSRLRRRVWGLSGRLVASYILVTLAVVVLVELVVLCVQVTPLALGAQLQAELQAQVDATARSYAQQLAQHYPDVVPAGTVLGDAGRPARPGQAAVRDGTLLVPAITGRVHSNQAVTAVVALAADGTVVASSAPARYPPGRAAASELPVQASGSIPGAPAGIKPGDVPTPFGSVVFWIARAGSRAATGTPPAGTRALVSYVYVQAPWSSPALLTPVRAWQELEQRGETLALVSGPLALLVAIVPVGVLSGC